MNSLLAISPTEREISLLRSQYNATDRTVRSEELASLTNTKGGRPTINAAYGRFGRRLCSHLEIDPDEGSGSEKDRWWSIWSVGYRTNQGFYWEMHNEVAEAIERLGWIKKFENESRNESNTFLPIFEGESQRAEVNTYERSLRARRLCLEHYGSSCFICKFDFNSKYGNKAAGYIQVHHLRPLSEIARRYQVDPIQDLRPVCPNCHAVIHIRTPAYTISEVKEMICD